MTRDRRWPDFFLVGAMKAGTSSLYNYLGKHPNVFVPKPKEPHFFVCDSCRQRRLLISSSIASESRYRDLFRDAGDDQLVGDFSVSNLWCESAAQRIADRVPDAKIIAVLRNPIERCLSHYVMCVQQGLEHRSFSEAIDAEITGRDRSFGYVEVGRYATQLARYDSVFRDGQTRVLFYDDLVRNKVSLLDEILMFIGVEGTIPAREIDFSANTGGRLRGGLFAVLYKNRKYYLPYLSKVVPKSRRAKVRDALFIERSRYPSMTDRDRARLASVYASDIEALTRRTGRDLSGWLGATG
ncbi:MAG: sulfotransferase [Rhodospirillales bacterium]